ncbi:MAG: hypothetical protein U9N14_04085, partial [Pseudomonadota bacterium]|nr:hypothetical protein [Pseudomonadota bacterium]
YSGYGVGLVLLASLGIALFGPLVIQLMTPPVYHSAGRWVPWLALLIGLHTVSNYVNVGCYAQKTGLVPMTVNGLAALVALLGYVLLIPIYGVVGALAATLIAQLLRLSLFFLLSQRLVELPYRYARMGTLVALAIFGVVLIDPGQAGWEKAAIGTIFWLAMVAVGGMLDLVPGPRALSGRDFERSVTQEA